MRIWHEPARQKLQGNEAVQFGVLSLVDNTHTAAAKFIEDAVMGNSLGRLGTRTPAFRAHLRLSQKASQRRETAYGLSPD
jgi:hypothetical protein